MSLWLTVRTVRQGVANRPGTAALAALSLLLIASAVVRVNCVWARYDFDGYDEGVYWQTLRAMRAGYGLYRDAFCAQPPGFLLLLYPFYAALSPGIAGARLGVLAVSLLGVGGASLLGGALGGRVGAAGAAILAAAAPLCFAASFRLQAEGPATALLLVTVGAGCAASQCRGRQARLVLGALCGASLSLGIAVKLLDVTALVPLPLLAAGQLWRAGYAPSGDRRRLGASVAVTAAAAGATALVVLFPFRLDVRPLLAQVVSFHVAARAAMAVAGPGNAAVVARFFLANAPLAAAATAGVAAAALRRDWRLVPLAAWLAATCLLLVLQRPLFARHAIVLIPPLVALLALGLRDVPLLGHPGTSRRDAWRRRAAALAAACALAALAAGAAADAQAYAAAVGAERDGDRARRDARMTQDLAQATTPTGWVITDAPFLAGLAGRDVPPWLADTSLVRIRSGYLTAPELIRAAADFRVEAVLFATGRLAQPRLAAFQEFVARHFTLRRVYPPGGELWVR